MEVTLADPNVLKPYSWYSMDDENDFVTDKLVKELNCGAEQFVPDIILEVSVK